jgi:hypothetical protein
MAENEPVDPNHLADLAQELRELLEDELAAGNRVVETYRGWPAQNSIFVMLARPFTRKPDPLPFGVVFREINDTHYWRAEYEHQEKRHILACGFDR